jgi:ESCRT-I complex subunit TSG101
VIVIIYIFIWFYFRIVNTFAEEAALEDSIYYLGEAFRGNKSELDLEQFQKQIRTLARKQFMLRAILQKCREKAGLAG